MSKDKPFVQRYLLADVTKTRYYGVVHILGSHVVITSHERQNSIVYLDSDLERAKQALKDDHVHYVVIPLKEDQLITLLDWQANP